ncbi:hypothetical protein K443DRAFT_682935 [Laccaria amethystina LaAM-08-1]|uniref:Unplaced genomic scaffold K443scaffold_216, whole genome shotgun sequence n=1 Tax=Laccaria amethystina LaAM-08-1 TaxID=1095629 RepID=A0A0C9WK01_9AGAR|nr:hypothetical protein K443DRAFT_682935 [Laccaria amethystina LaAM-08-1]
MVSVANSLGLPTNFVIIELEYVLQAVFIYALFSRAQYPLVHHLLCDLRRRITPVMTTTPSCVKNSTRVPIPKEFLQSTASGSRGLDCIHISDSDHCRGILHPVSSPSLAEGWRTRDGDAGPGF